MTVLGSGKGLQLVGGLDRIRKQARCRGGEGEGEGPKDAAVTTPEAVAQNKQGLFLTR